MASVQPRQSDHLKRNEKKWSKPLMDAGFTVIPNVLLQRQRALPLDPVELSIFVYLASRWWDAENPPYPSVKDIAEVTGVSARTVQRRMKRLEDDGLIIREARSDHRGQTSNRYHFNKLIEALTPFAEEEIADRKQRKKEADAKRTRKRPRKLQVVK